jgi:hypothetical protein
MHKSTERTRLSSYVRLANALLHDGRQVRSLSTGLLLVRLRQARDHLAVLVLALVQVGIQLSDALLQSIQLHPDDEKEKRTQ